jgi:hypothetical protein
MKLDLVEPRVTTFAKLPRYFLVLDIKEEADMPACMVPDLLGGMDSEIFSRMETQA